MPVRVWLRRLHTHSSRCPATRRGSCRVLFFLNSIRELHLLDPGYGEGALGLPPQQVLNAKDRTAAVQECMGGLASSWSPYACMQIRILHEGCMCSPLPACRCSTRRADRPRCKSAWADGIYIVNWSRPCMHALWNGLNCRRHVYIAQRPRGLCLNV